MPDSFFIRYPSTIAVLYFLLAASSLSARRSMTCTITLAGDHGEKAQEIKNECGRFLWPCSSGISLT